MLLHAFIIKIFNNKIIGFFKKNSKRYNKKNLNSINFTKKILIQSHHFSSTTLGKLFKLIS